MTAAPPRFRVDFWALALLALTGVAACGSDDHGHEGVASGATCPTTGDIPTYENFGRSFMSTYCTRCHSAMATDRHGAPADHNFDTLSQIKVFADHIDERAAAGPSAVNTEMPPEDPKPSEDDRRKLGQWLACETGGGDADGGTGDGGGQGDSGGGQGDGGGGDSGRGGGDGGARDATSDGSRGGG